MYNKRQTSEENRGKEYLVSSQVVASSSLSGRRHFHKRRTSIPNERVPVDVVQVTIELLLL
jgi:hypothetical protein